MTDQNEGTALPDAGETLSRRQRAQEAVDALIEVWPTATDPRPDEDVITAVDAVNKLVQDPEVGLPAVLLAACDNIGYRVLVDQEITEFPTEQTTMTAAFETQAHPRSAKNAVGWVLGMLNKEPATLLAISLQSMVKRADAFESFSALCDLGAALRSGRAEVTLRPTEDDETQETELFIERPVDQVEIKDDAL